MNVSDLKKHISSGAAFRTRITIQPMGGPGDKVFPPTYLGAEYATEKRWIGNDSDGNPQTTDCVQLDSVQSQANRMEDALQEAYDSQRIKLPVIEVDFSDIELIDQVDKITSLQAPHRIADAILRDSELDGVAFRKSEVGKQIDSVGNKNATPLFELCPTALLLGVWDSTGPKGGLGAKFARALVSEIVGFNVSAGVKTGSRIDPLEIRAGAQVIKKGDQWKLAQKGDKKPVSPSEINHGNIPPTIDKNAGGVTISHAEQTTVISLPALRRLRFPVDGEYKTEYDEAARCVLLALGFVATALAGEQGLDLRSRCLLWPTEVPKWEFLGKPGTEPEVVEMDTDAAINLYHEAVDAAIKAGLPYRTDPVVLKPSKALAELLQRSQEIAAATDTEVE